MCYSFCWDVGGSGGANKKKSLDLHIPRALCLIEEVEDAWENIGWLQKELQTTGHGVVFQTYQRSGSTAIHLESHVSETSTGRGGKSTGKT